uniref:ER membrane protein complex subunit 1 n=1 Tax=Trichogramma kaykai TaxID=54128 RepID=A0ABD2XHY3_9HYME
MARTMGCDQLVRCLLVLFTLFNLSFCLYEDQVGKFDWKQSYVGKIKFATFDTTTNPKKIIVATEENVIAALNINSGLYDFIANYFYISMLFKLNTSIKLSIKFAGQLLWRRVLEKGYAGHIRAFGHANDKELVTVNGGVPAIVRYWNVATGHILNEWSLAEQNPDKIEDIQWYIKDGTLHHVLPVYNSGIEVSSYDCKTGEKLKSRKISAPFISPETECVLAAPNYVCLSGDSSLAILFYVNIFELKSEPQSITINTIFGAGTQGPYQISLVPGNTAAILISAENNRRKRLVQLEKEPILIPCDINGDNSVYIATIDNNKVVLETSYKNDVTTITTTELSTSTNPSTEKVAYVANNVLYKPSIAAIHCQPQSLKGKLCKYLLTNEDDSVSLLQQKVMWTREEALANIVAVEFVELPMSEREQAIETEFDRKERNVASMLLRRLTSQANQIRAYFQATLGLEPKQSDRRADLVRDKFGLHKMIVVATKAGKLFGIESRRGEVIWQQRVPNLRVLSEDPDQMILYLQRGSRHYPHPPQCALLAADQRTGNGVIFTFNPMNGQPLSGGLQHLDHRIKQSMLLQDSIDGFLRGFIVLDEKDQVHVYPKTAATVVASQAGRTFIFTVDKTTGVLAGHSLAYSNEKKLAAHKVWEMVLPPKTQKIIHVVGKKSYERVHSQGRVLSDRSVLYKYVNPNLVVVVTQGVEGSQKNTLNLYLLDVVSGLMIFSLSHKRTKGPVHIVHSENWVVYSYFNEKSRRTELATLELYEGKMQSNDTAFSSLNNYKLPIVERQAYIFPASIESLQETITEKGITSKHILVALANGGVLELPWMLVDPRRPLNPDYREENVIPYMPELPIQMDRFINYNQSVYRVAGINTSPSGLESTCLVFVHGLDLFYSRVAPSKTFDVLKEDFDYYLIVIVLVALLCASYGTKKLASQKVQKQAWK